MTTFFRDFYTREGGTKLAKVALKYKAAAKQLALLANVGSGFSVATAKQFPLYNSIVHISKAFISTL